MVQSKRRESPTHHIDKRQTNEVTLFSYRNLNDIAKECLIHFDCGRDVSCLVKNIYSVLLGI
jgi:hypothetical protein